MNGEWLKICKETVVTYLNVGLLSRHSPRRTEENPQNMSVRLAGNPTAIRLLILRHSVGRYEKTIGKNG
jgi:hypothetical protein